MPLLQEPLLEYQPVAEIIKTVIIGSLTILIALCFREFLITIMNHVMPEKGSNKLIFQGFITAFVLLVTIIIASVWK